MQVFWLEATPWDTDGGVDVTVRACSADLEPIVNFGGGQEWLPVLAAGPIFDTAVFNGQFTGSGDSTRGSIEVMAEAGEVDEWARYGWAARSVQIWTATIDSSDPLAPVYPASRTLIFDGEAESFDPDQAGIFLSVKKPNGTVAYETYAGTGGLEGSASLVDVVKPFAAGEHVNRPPVLVDPSKLLFQVHGYGAIEELIAVRERGLELDQTFVPHATSTSLLAATVPATEIHYHLDSGSFRLGFTPAGNITADFIGHKVGASPAATTLAGVVAALLVSSGWSVLKIDDDSFGYVDGQLPYTVTYHDEAGEDVLSAITNLMLGAGGYWDIDELGNFYIGLVGSVGTEDFSIGDEDLGVADYDISEIDHVPVRPPFWRTRVAYARNPQVMNFSDTEAGATAEQLELIADLQDEIDGKIDVFFQSSAPASANVDDLWYDTDDGKSYRWVLGTGWVLLQDSDIATALAAAAGAQSTADGKITTFTQSATPTTTKVGDLWVKTDETPRQVRSWNGTTWVVVSSVGATAGGNLYRSDGSTVLTQGEVRTQEGTAAAILGQGALATQSTVNGSLIDPGSVTIYNLASSPGNLIENSDFATGDLTGWRPYFNPSLLSVVPRGTAGVPANAPSGHVARIQYTGGAGNISVFAAGKAYTDPGSDQDGFAAVPGEQYLVQLHAARNSTYAGNVLIVYAYYLKSDGTAASIATVLNVNMNAIAANTWVALSGVFTAPADARRVWLYVYSSSQTDGALFFTNLFCDRMRGERDLRATAVRLGVNIVRNDGSTSVSDATAITALGTAAAITGQGPGATAPGNDVLNYVDSSGGGSGTTLIRQPGGGVYAYDGGGITGFIKIALPNGYTNTMVRFTVDIFNYVTGTMQTYIVSGYTYTAGGWLQLSAQYIGPETSSKAVRFGNDGPKACVWIGDASTVWQYPKVVVRDVILGYSNNAASSWKSGWVISVTTTAIPVIDGGVLKPRPGDAVFGEGIFEGPGGAVATNANFKTILGTAAAFAGQGSLASKNFVGAADVVTPNLAALSAELGNVFINSGALVVSNGTTMKVIANGFGTANQFLEWAGPAMALNLCSEANATSYLKSNGDAYFGGTLSAGTLTNSGQTSSLATNASILVGPFGTNGNPIVVAVSWGYSETINKTYAATTTGLSQFNADVATYGATSSDGSYYTGSTSETVASSTLTLARKIGAGSFSNVASGSNTSRTSTFTGTKPVVGDSSGSSTIRTSATIAFTYTDTAGGSSDREFQATLARGWSFGGGTIAQRVAIVATEE